MPRRLPLIVLAACLLASAALAQAPAAPTPPKLRILRPGDWWEYTSGTVIKVQERQVKLTETRRVRILADRKTSPKGVSCLVMSIETITEGLGPSHESHSEALFVQDADGSFVVHGRLRSDDDKIQWIEEPSRGWVIDVKSPFTVGTTWSDTYKMSDGTTGDQTSSMLKEGGLEVPAGTFQTYRVYSQVSESDGLRVCSMDWYSPRLGTTVCTMAVVKTGDGMTVVTSEVLKRYGLVADAEAK